MVAETVDGVALAVGVEGQVVETTVGQTVAVICINPRCQYGRPKSVLVFEPTLRILHLGNQAHFGQVRDAFVHAAASAEAGYLLNERCWDEFMVLAALFNLDRTLAHVSGGAL